MSTSTATRIQFKSDRIRKGSYVSLGVGARKRLGRVTHREGEYVAVKFSDNSGAWWGPRNVLDLVLITKPNA